VALLPTMVELEKAAGKVNYNAGLVLVRRGKVTNIKHDHQNGWDWRARVWDFGEYRASLSLDGDSVTVNCTCSTIAAPKWCPHIVALMATLQSYPKETPQWRYATTTPEVVTPTVALPSNTPEYAMTQRLLKAFQTTRKDSPIHANVQEAKPLIIEFGLRIISDHYNSMLALTIKIGIKRVYFVPKLVQFLSTIIGKESKIDVRYVHFAFPRLLFLNTLYQ